MTDHPMIRAYGQAVHMPGAHHRLPRGRFGERPVLAQRLDHPPELGGGGHVGADDPAGHQRGAHRVQHVPRGQHVQHHPVHVPFGRLGQVAHPQCVGGMRPAEEGLDVLLGDRGEIGPPFVGDEVSGVADSPQQRA